MRHSFANAWIALVVTLSLPIGSAGASGAPETAATAPLQRFTLENSLLRWSAQGLRDHQGNVVVAASSRTLVPLDQGRWMQGDGNLGGSLLDAQGRKIAGPFAYLEQPAPEAGTLIFSNDGPPAMEENKSGLIRSDGRVVAEPIHAGLRQLENTGLFSFRRARRYGVLDAQGKQVLPPSYDSIQSMQRLLLVGKLGQLALFDRAGNNLTGFRDDSEYRAIEGTALILECRQPHGQDKSDTEYHWRTGSDSRRCRVLDADLRPTLEGEFSNVVYLPGAQRWLTTPYRAPSVEQELCFEGLEEKTIQLRSPDGRLLKEIPAGSVSETKGGRLIVSEGVCQGRLREMEGLMDRDGNWLLKPRYASIRLLEIASDDASADLPPQFRIERSDEEGRTHTGVADASGHIVLPLGDHSILARYPSLGLYLAKKNDRLGVMDSQGRWRIAPKHMLVERHNTLPLPYLLLLDYRPYSDHEQFNHILYNLANGRPVLHGQYEHLDPNDSYWPLEQRAPWPEFVIVAARRDGKFGVIDLDENVVVPFVYDNIESPDLMGRMYAKTHQDDEENGEESAEDKRPQERVNGLSPPRLARLHAMVSRQIREQHAPVAEESMPYAGRYVPVAYRSAEKVQAAVETGALSRPVAPTLLLDNDTAILDLDMVSSSARPPLGILQHYCLRNDGFDILMSGADRSERVCDDPAAPRLTLLTQANDEWECSNCAALGLPTRWWRTDPAPAPQMP